MHDPRTIIVPKAARGNPARLLVLEPGFSVAASAAIAFTIVRAGRTDQTVSVNWTITGITTLPAASGIETFTAGQVTRIVNLTAPASSGDGVLKLSNPQVISGSSVPAELGTNVVVGITVTGSAEDPADIIVIPNGTGDFTTINAGINAASPGEIVEVRSNVPGVLTYFVEEIVPTVSGTAANPIIVRVRAGDRIVPYSNGGYTLTITNRSYLIFRLFEFGEMSLWTHLGYGTVGSSQWLNSVGGRAVSSRRNLQIESGTNHVLFEDCKVWGGRANPVSKGNVITISCEYIGFRRCNFELTGTNQDLNPSAYPDERGDLLDNGAAHCYFEECAFALGGHDAFIQRGSFVVARNCTFDQSWIKAPENTGIPGARCGDFGAADNRGAGIGPAMLEGCSMQGVGASGDQGASSMFKLTGRGMIIRDNYGFNWTAGQGDVLSLAPDDATDPSNSTEHDRIYNNTFSKPGAFLRVVSHAQVPINLQDIRVFNNICTKAQDNTKGDGFDEDDLGYPPPHGWAIFMNTLSANQQGYPDKWLGMQIRNNLLHKEAEPFDVRLRTDPTVYTVAGATAAYPNVLSGNITDAAIFVDENATTKAGFALDTGSPGIGAARHMTTIVSTVTATTITLEDAFWLYDGWGLAWFGEDLKTDYFKIVPPGMDPSSNGTIHRVTYGGVNTATGQVTLTSIASVTAGHEVWRVLSDGVTVADNMGAWQ